MNRIVFCCWMVGGASFLLAATPTYEDFSAWTRERYGLKGPVKTMKECLDVDVCEVTTFNRFGVDVDSLKNRTFKGKVGNLLVFETVMPSGNKFNSTGEQAIKTEKFNTQKQLVFSQTVIASTASPVFLEERAYQNQRLLKITEKASTGKDTFEVKVNEYFYVKNRLDHVKVSILDEGPQGSHVVHTEVKKFDVNGEVKSSSARKYTYVVDKHGNWTEERINNQVNVTRQFTYY